MRYKKIRTRKKNSYIHEEWQEHQYDPGYYVGGKIPHYLVSPGNRKLLGISLLIPAAMFTTIIVIFVVFAIQGTMGNAIQGAIVLSILATPLYVAGIRQITQHYRELRQQGSKENFFKKDMIWLVKFLIIVAVIISMLGFISWIIIRQYDKFESVEIHSRDDIYLGRDYDNTYYLGLNKSDDPNKIYDPNRISNYNFTIECPKEVCDLLNVDEWKAKKYVITYKWNTLLKGNGKFIKIE